MEITTEIAVEVLAKIITEITTKFAVEVLAEVITEILII
jgi:hypothetical protein